VRRPARIPEALTALGLLAIALGLAAECRTYARPDTGFLLDAAARVLAGQRLYVDVVEINPPLVIALNLPAVLAARLPGVSAVAAYRAEVAIVVLAMLLAARPLLRRLLPDRPVTRAGLGAAAAFALFPLTGQDYGEREHLGLALLLPYLLLVALRAERAPVSARPAMGVGLLAGVAFALKPHFVVVWLALEAWLAFGRRARSWTPAPETVATASFLAAYGAAVVLFVPAYLRLVALLAGPYSRFLYDPFLHLLLTGPGIPLTAFALLVWAVLKRHARHPTLWDVAAITTVACVVAGAAQQKGLRYHFYPSFALATMLLALATLDAVRPEALARRLYRAAAALAFAATVLVVAVQNGALALGLPRDSERSQLEELIGLVRARAAGEPVFVFSYHIGSAYPLVNYSGARSASRFPQLWILAADYLDALHGPEPLRYHTAAEMSQSERYLNQAVREDLETGRPCLLIVYRAARDRPQNGYRRLDYVAYFSRDPRIARMFAHYQRIARTGDYDVYERVPDGVALSGPAMVPETPTQDILPVQRRPGL
jgi:hypothetical protein